MLISGLPRTCNFLIFENYGQEVGKDQHIVGSPNLEVEGDQSPPVPYGCCTYDLTTVSKVIERLVLARLRLNLLASLSFARLHVQSAYRRGHSTDMATARHEQCVGGRRREEGYCVGERGPVILPKYLIFLYFSDP